MIQDLLFPNKYLKERISRNENETPKHGTGEFPMNLNIINLIQWTHTYNLKSLEMGNNLYIKHPLFIVLTIVVENYNLSIYYH